MKLTILGSGTCVIKEKRSSAAFLLHAGKQSCLIDCGWGAPDKLVKAGQDIQELDHIIISHPHADHMGSLMNVLQSMLVSGMDISGPGHRARKRSKPLHLHGYKGFARDYEALRRIEVPERVEPYKIRMWEYYKKTSHVFKGMRITGARVPHVQQFFNSAAFRIDYGGKSIMYGGDSRFDNAEVDLARGADIAILEASVPPGMFRKGPRPNHLSAYECGVIAKLAKVRTLVLVHLYDNATERSLEREVRKSFDGKLVIAHDLQEIKV